MTRRFQNLASQWRDTHHLRDSQLASVIRDDRIDILVDLKLHTAGNRLTVFAHKPAPLRVTWLGYPGPSGLETIGYRITDSFLDPPGQPDASDAEKPFRLPDCFWCYDPLCAEPFVNPLPAHSNRFITFGCLNNFGKINEQLLHLWVRILNAVQDSRMVILAPEGSHRGRLLDLLQHHGIASERIRFFPRSSRLKYLAEYHHIDIVLDTFPYNGHTTTFDALWMGVPVVSLAGSTAVSRGGLSILSNIGLSELVASTPEQYVQIAVALANDLPRLTDLRSTLRERMERSPLMDAPRFTHGVESAYREMWQKWCETHSSQ